MPGCVRVQQKKPQTEPQQEEPSLQNGKTCTGATQFATHPSIFNPRFFLSSGSQGSTGASPRCHRRNAGGHPGQGTSSLQDHTEKKNKDKLLLTLRDNLEFSHCLTCIYLDCELKLQNLERTMSADSQRSPSMMTRALIVRRADLVFSK